MESMKHFLFYEKKTDKKLFKSNLPSEKYLKTGYAITALFFLCIFIICTFVYSTDQLYAGFMFGGVWLFLFAGLPFLCHMAEKSYWVIFEDTYVLRHGSNWGCMGKKKIFYKDVRYIITGDVGPYIYPGRISREWYHRKWGNYINALSAEKEPLFTIRYSEEILNLIQEKCQNAERKQIC